MELTKDETTTLVTYLEKMDREHDGIPYQVQEIAEKLYNTIEAN